jgi:nucleotide-binding universal stress UspA family protein
MFRKILVGFDGSRNARAALRIAVGMATSVSGEAVVAIVASASHGETEEDRQAAFEAEAGGIRAVADQEIAAARSAASCSIHIVPGDRPAAAMSAYVDQHGYDLLIVGRHGRERASHGGLGRVARELADNATCPLLLIGDGNPGPK